MERTPLYRSLRLQTMLVVIGVVITPVILVWLADGTDARARGRMLHRVERAAAEAAAARGVQDRAAVALENGVWLRAVDAHDVITLEVDAEAPSRLAEQWGKIFFGPDGAPTLRQWDARAPPLLEREVLREARAGRSAARCEETEERTLLVCQAAAPSAEGEVVHVQESSRRAIRALYDVRYQILKLAVFTGIAGLLLGGWLGGRVVRPVEKLRDALRARMDSEHPTEPIGWTRRDELGELARDIDRLLGRLAERSAAISERAAAEAERAAAEAERSQALAEKAEAEAARNAALVEHARATEAFVADMAHEFKNPVAAIRAAAESLAGEVAIDRERAGRLARVLADSSGRLDALLSRLLELVRAEAGLASEAREPVPLHTLLEGLVGALRDRHELVMVSLDSTPAWVEGVPGRLEDALRNVLENAAAAASPGGPEAWIGVAMRLEEHCGQPGVSIGISDSGPGISEQDLPRIFDRFFTTRASQGGTGLGLALSRAIIEAHGGTITAASPPGGGAVMTIHLPTLPTDPEADS